MISVPVRPIGRTGTGEATDVSVKAEPVVGAIGLWVDNGTVGYFTNLRVTPHPAS